MKGEGSETSYSRRHTFRPRTMCGHNPKHRISISPDKATQLPLHDARILQVDTEFAEDGYLVASVKVEVNPEGSLVSFRELGIEKPSLTLKFQDCWQISNNLLGFATGREVITRFDAIEQSELKEKLRAFQVGSSAMIHYRIEGSHGSRLDFVAESLSIEGRPPTP
jgi:hypothetical protein